MLKISGGGYRSTCLIALILSVLYLAVSISVPSASYGDTESPTSDSTVYEENVTVSIPTRVPICVKADGTISMPDAHTWQIENHGGTDVTVSSISSSDMSEDIIKLGLQTGDEYMFDDESHALGHWDFEYSDGKDVFSKSAGTADNPLMISNGFPLNVGWYTEVSDSALRSASSEPRGIGTVSFSFRPVYKETFAVYNSDVRSLDFYKRTNLAVPAEGDTFDGKRADSVFPIDTENGYHQRFVNSAGAGMNVSVPWCHLMNKAQIDTVTVRDVINPKSTSWWFEHGQMKTLDLTKLDMSRCVDAQRMFSYNGNIVSIEGMDTWDMSSLENAYAMFDGFFNRMNDISFCRNWNMSKCRNFGAMFYNTFGMENVDFGNWDCPSFSMAATSDDGHTGDSTIFGTTEGHPKIRNIKVSASSARLAPILFDIDYRRVEHATGKWYCTTDGNVYAIGSVPSDRAASYTMQLDAGEIIGSMSGKGIQGYNLTVDATTSNFGKIPFMYRWQRWGGVDTLPWIDIVSGTDNASVTVSAGWQNDHVRCIVSSATGRYSCPEKTIEFPDVMKRTMWTENTARIVDDGNGTLRVEADGVPDRETYGDTDMSVDWYVDAGNGSIAKGTDTRLHKLADNASTAWWAFVDQVTVFLGQTYRLSYDSIELLSGKPLDIKITLYEWTDEPSSQPVIRFGTIPYGSNPGHVDIEIPSDLNANHNYRIVVSAGFGQCVDYDAVIRNMSFSCLTKGGYIYISSGQIFDTAKYRGHSVVAVVMPRNDYFTMSRVVTAPVAVG